MTITDRLAELGLVPAAAMQPPPGVTFPFEPVRISGDLAYVSGHLPLEADGSVAHPRGKVGGPVSAEQAQHAAGLVALAMFGSLEREVGSLDRVTRWLRVFGMVNHVEGFGGQPAVINGFSQRVLDVFGPEIGAHSRSAIGVAGLPFDVPVEIEAIVELGPPSWNSRSHRP